MDGAVVTDHLHQVELAAAFLGQRQADQAAGFAGHEADRGRGAGIGGQQDVAFVLAIFVIDQDDHLAGPEILDDRFDGMDGHGYLSGVWIVL